MKPVEERIEELKSKLAKREERYRQEREKALLELRSIEARRKEKESKQKRRKIYRAGELCDLAGVADLEPQVLLGGLLRIAEVIKDPAVASPLRQRGEKLLAIQKAPTRHDK